MIRFHNIKKIYDDSYVAVDNINLAIKAGEFVSLVGTSGAGKSTLLRMLTREVRPTSGEILVDGVDLADVGDREIPFLRRKIGTIYQDFKLLSHKTAFENVAFALEVSGEPEHDISIDVPQILSVVGLGDKIGNFPHQMSGGERQRLAIARAMIHRPKIVLADEPTGNLDLVNSYDVLKLLEKINELGTTVILATHDDKIVNAVGKRVITMDKGRIVRDQQVSGKYVL